MINYQNLPEAMKEVIAGFASAGGISLEVVADYIEEENLDENEEINEPQVLEMLDKKSFRF